MNIIEKYGKKKIAIATGLAVVAIGATGYLAYESMQPKMELVGTEVVVEYGSLVSDVCSTYLVEDLEGCSVSVSGSNEEGKEYFGIGEYEVTLTYRKETAVKKVSVIDTAKPVFNDKFVDSIEVEYGISNEEIASRFDGTADDLSPVEITVDEVDTSVSGEHKVSVVAKDSSMNEEIKEAVVSVKEEPQPEPEPQPQAPSYANSGSSGNGYSSNSGSGNQAVAPAPAPQQPTPAPQPSVCVVDPEYKSRLGVNGLDFGDDFDAAAAWVNANTPPRVVGSVYAVLDSCGNLHYSAHQKEMHN